LENGAGSDFEFRQVAGRAKARRCGARFDRVHSDLEAEMKKAVDFAVAAPYPAVDEVGEDVYA
jgi:TPP-dependent pyruvate/acetoin dehydrogenase alpha subunit